MKTNHETITVEGGAAGKPNQDAVYDLLHRAVKHIPRAHRIGWYHTLARYTGHPLTTHPNQAEREYIAWSQAKHTPPQRTP